MSEASEARQVGWIAGYGLAMTRRDNPGVASGYLPWTSFVPGWVPDAQGDPVTVAWRAGWSEGLAAGKAEWPESLRHEETMRVRRAEVDRRYEQMTRDMRDRP